MHHSLFSQIRIHSRFAKVSARKRRQGGSAAPVENLETRLLLAAEIRVVTSNIQPEINSLTDVGGRLYFVGNGEIETSDGREQGTRPVNQGESGFFPRELTSSGGTLFYSAKTDPTGGFELWKSDGTPSGTGLVKDIRPGVAGSGPSELTDVGGTMFFFANDGTTGVELWKSDGTAAGTMLVKDINPGIADSLPRWLTNIGGTLYFRANDGINGPELWRSDGTAAGTVLVQDSVPGINGSNPAQITEVNGNVLYTTHQHANQGLWKSDGTDAGTGVVRVFIPQSDFGAPRELTEAGGTLYFRAGPPAPGNGVELWKSDGTPAGTVKVTEIGGGQETDHSFTDFNGMLVFKAAGETLWKSDGTASGTVQFGAYTPGFQNGFPQTLPIPVHNGLLYFVLNGQLLQSDTSTSVPVSGFPFSGGSYSDSFVSVGDTLYLRVQGQLSELHEVSAPAVVQPATFATSVHPTINWTAVPSATSYEIVVTDLTRGIDEFVRQTVAGTSLVPTVDFGIGRFSVSVRVATTADGKQSNWSSPYVFRNYLRVSMLPMARYQTTAQPTIAWNPLQGASTYDIWINNITTGQSQFIRDTTVYTTSFTPLVDLPMGVYKAWVRGFTNDGITGFFSQPTEFVVVPAPTATSPLNSTFSRQPTFSWNPVAGAASYEIVVRDANTGANIHTATNIQTTSSTPTADLPPGPYRWWVTAVSSDGYRSSAPPVIDFFIGGRTNVLSPTGSTTDRTPTFSWRPVDGAAAFRLQVDRLDVPTVRVIFVTSLVVATQYTPTTPLSAGSYRVWVQAIGTFGELSPWSMPVDFQVTQSAEPERFTLVPMLTAVDVRSILNDGTPQSLPTRKTPIVRNDNLASAAGGANDNIDVVFVQHDPATRPSSGAHRHGLPVNTIRHSLIDLLMAADGATNNLTWMF